MQRRKGLGDYVICSEAIHPRYTVFRGSGSRLDVMVEGVCNDSSKLQLISILSVSTCTSPEEETHKAKRKKAQREERIKCFNMN